MTKSTDKRQQLQSAFPGTAKIAGRISPSAAALGIRPKTDQAGRLVEPQASSRPGRFWPDARGKPKASKVGRAFFGSFLYTPEQRKNLPPGKPRLAVSILGHTKMSDRHIGNKIKWIVANNCFRRLGGLKSVPSIFVGLSDVSTLNMWKILEQGHSNLSCCFDMCRE